MRPPDLIKPELREETRAAADGLWKNGSAVFETCQVTRDGREVPVEISSRSVRIGDRMMGVAIARDITERKRIERDKQEHAIEVERDKRRFYRETILAVTGGRFEIADPEPAEGWIEDPVVSMRVAVSQEMVDARHALTSYCQQAGMDEDSVREFELAIGEALGNAVKHAGEGWMYVGRHEESVWAAVVDHGKGIDTFIIPKVALLAGFTTKASMGLGYTLILRVCDHVKLATGPDGTTVVMEKSLKPASEIDSRLSVFTGVE
jgi:anti-sigma regulatory factor (Ser/Thr protein kinase)